MHAIQSRRSWTNDYQQLCRLHGRKWYVHVLQCLLRHGVLVLQYTVPVGLAWVRFLEWWYASEQGKKRGGGGEGVPPPPQRLAMVSDTRSRYAAHFSRLSKVVGGPVVGNSTHSTDSIIDSTRFTTGSTSTDSTHSSNSTNNVYTTCALCGNQRTNPAVIPSGYLFCYPCIYSYVSVHGKCPLTFGETELASIRRIYMSN